MRIGRLAFYRIVRDRRRSLLQAAGIGLVTVLLMVWSSLTAGFSNTIYQMATRLILGQIQIHKPAFIVSESIYDSFSFSSEQELSLRRQGFAATYRLYQYVLASHGDSTKGARIIGLDPTLEAQTTDLPHHLSQGRFITDSNAKDAVVAFDVARILKLKLGAELVILGTAADGSIASEIFTVVGILRPISQVIDDRHIYIGAQAFRTLFSFPSGVHELVLTTIDSSGRYHEPSGLEIEKLFPDARLRTWRDIKPQLSQVLDLVRFSSILTLGFISVALGMLILNLKIMTTFDRLREYGVMLAVGLHPRQLRALVVLESLWLALAAGIFATAVGIPLAKLTEVHGIDFRFLVDNMAFSNLVLQPTLYGYVGSEQVIMPLLFLFITLPLASVYPAILAGRTEPKTAIHGKDPSS